MILLHVCILRRELFRWVVVELFLAATQFNSIQLVKFRFALVFPLFSPPLCLEELGNTLLSLAFTRLQTLEMLWMNYPWSFECCGMNMRYSGLIYPINEIKGCCREPWICVAILWHETLLASCYGYRQLLHRLHFIVPYLSPPNQIWPERVSARGFTVQCQQPQPSVQCWSLRHELLQRPSRHWG